MAAKPDPNTNQKPDTGENRKPDIPPPPLCFTLDGKRYPASERLLKACEELGAALLEDARKHDKEYPNEWAWCRLRLGELTRDPVVSVTYGGAKERPNDGLAEVAIVGAP